MVLESHQYYTLQLLNLPSELLVEIFRNLSYQDILRCYRVCQLLKLIIKSSVELQYQIELGADGMIDGPPSSLGTAARMSLLLDRRSAWARLLWKQRLTVPVSGSCQAYELVAGVFAKMTPVRTDGWQGSRHFVASWLPSNQDAGSTLERADVGLLTRDFAIDPTQDLVAFMEITQETAEGETGYQIHINLRTLSSNLNHPRASVPILHHHTPSAISTAFIQIVDDVVGTFLWAPGPKIFIWNWKTGRLLVHRTAPPETNDFSFLSSRAYILTNIFEQGSIEIYTFGSSDLSSSHIASLLLPPIQEDMFIAQLTTHTGPFHARCPSNKPFTTSSDSRIHIVSIEYLPRLSTVNVGSRYCFFIHNRFLLSCLMSQKVPSGAAVPWPDWGPRNTRFLVHCAPFQWLRYIHGQRVVCPPLRHDGTHLIQILDFNVHPYQRGTPVDMSILDEGIAAKKLVMEPSQVAEDALFIEPVTTSLPYYVLFRTDTENYSGFMIDEERLVGIQSNSFSIGPMKDIHVFTF